MKLGVEIKIDVTKIQKDRIFVGEKGKYLSLTTFIDTENPGQFGDHGFISHKKTKEEQEQKINTPIVGNCRVFYIDMQNQNNENQQQQAAQNVQNTFQGSQPLPPDDIPF